MMLKRMEIPKTRDSYDIGVKGVICGVNIKPIKTKSKKYKKKVWFSKDGIDTTQTKTTWGMFIHIRMEDGSQYDAVFHMVKTFSLDDYNQLSIDGDKTDKRSSALIPSIIKTLNVNEWVELIGTEVVVKSNDGRYPADNGFIFAAKNSNEYLIPSYYEIIRQ